jgi:SAM-dependent methyltransferase
MTVRMNDRDQGDRKPVDLCDLRRLAPIDPGFGLGRGKPIDRHYIERFLQRHACDISGVVLEVASDDYIRRFGEDRVRDTQILHADSSNPRATLVADLADTDGLPQSRFDCFICTQTLQYVYQVHDAVAGIHRLLKPGGVVLLTVPGITQISPYDRDRWGEYWRFTPQSVQRLLCECFDEDAVEVEGHGNVLASIGFLQGLACEDLTEAELDHVDDRYPMLVTARAVKAMEIGGRGV